MKIGFIASAFDLCHPGHLALLKEAKNHCDYLVCALHTDPTIDRPATKTKPIESTLERWLRLVSCKYVDEVVPYDTEADLLNLLTTLKPQVRFLGSDYIGKDFTGKYLEIPVMYLDRSHTFSSSELRKRILDRSM